MNLPKYNTIVNILCHKSQEQSNSDAFIFLEPNNSNNQESKLTYQELDQRSRHIAAQLQNLKLEGERALLLFPPGLEYLSAFFGCLYAGVIAVPAYPPRNKRNSPRIMAIINDAKPAIALTTESLLAKLQPLLTGTTEGEKMKWLGTDSLKHELENNWQAPKIEHDSIAFLQYTSGSTGMPKGVIVSHGNILHNATMTYRYMRHSSQSKFVSWLPMYHDMGLIGGIMQPLYGGFPCILMSPAYFLQNPYGWLKIISQYRGTTSGGPNFAYELCLEKITAEQRSTLDLSSWTVAFNGSEPIRFSTLKRFADTFSDCGFSMEAFYPCYGMAEATLMISGSNKKAIPTTKTLEKSALGQNQISEINDQQQNSQIVVSCGESIPEQKVIIVDPNKLTCCQDSQVGEIWVSSCSHKSIAQGYWKNPLETEKTFKAYLVDTGEGPFLRTGDLGFLEDGQIYIAGRLKDLIIIRGRNLYPQDIELTAENSHVSLRKLSNAAFSLEIEKEEKLFIVQELEFRAQPDLDVVITAIRQKVTEEHEVEVYGVVLIKPGSICKTSSGKIQRRETKLKLLNNKLDIIAQNLFNNGDISQINRPEIIKESSLKLYLQENLGQLLGESTQQINTLQPLNSLGLDSLRIFQLKNKIEADFSVIISVIDLLGELTIETLARLILEKNITNNLDNNYPFSLTPIIRNTQKFSLSFGQRRLWLLHQLNPGDTNYNVPLSLTFKGELNIPALTNSLNEIIRRHETLRTKFITDNGEPWQIIQDFSPIELPIVNPEDLNLDTQAKSQAFELSTEIPIRVTLICVHEQEYNLLINLHHIAIDGWSIQILLNELTALYQAFVNKKQMPLANLSIQYLDFTVWEQNKFQVNRERLLNYWRQQLQNEIHVLNLPTDYSRPPFSRFRGNRVTTILNETMTKALKSFSQQESTTVFMTLLAVFKILLYRYTSQTDILVGCPIANRNSSEFEKLIGFFVNILVLRTNLDAKLTFRKLLSIVRQVSLEAYEYQDLPFDELVKELQPERDLNYNPLFQVMFVWQKNINYSYELENLSLTCQENYNNTSKVDLTMFVTETEKELLLTLEYDSDLFKLDTAQRILGNFSTLVTKVVTNSDMMISELPLLTPSEQKQILRDWNNTQVDYQQPDSLTKLLEIQVNKTPEAIALQSENQQFTYRELNQKANQLAHYLQEQGVKPEVIVGVFMERSPGLVITLIAILKAGGAYLPLDPDYPQERLLFMLEDAQVSLILTQEKLLSRLSLSSTKLICVDRDWQDKVAQQNQENLSNQVRGENPAYVIYTSGSTGNPKGVINLHLAICNRLLWMQEIYQLTQEDRVLQKTPFSFDVSVWELFWPLLTGARLILAQPSGHKDTNYLVKLINQEKITIVHFVPSMLNLLLDHPNIEKCNCLRQVFCSGEALSIALQEKFFNCLDVKLDNLYGPTEAAIDVTFWHCQPNNNLKTVPIGYPIANTETYVLDQHLQPLPVGVPGELYLGGIGLARGYLNRPELTKEKFIKNPFSNDSEARLYKTGDLVKYHSDGSIEFLGRIDRQIKLRGLRLELGEIEAKLLEYEAVKEALIVFNEEQLIAYIIPKVFIQEEDLRNYLRKRLPEYMVPSTFHFLSRFPLLLNGKVDYKSLPAIENLDSSFTKSEQMPNSELEKKLMNIWQEILGRQKVGINDNFFDIGGNSLLMVKVNYQVHKKLSKDLSILEMFQYPTIKTLAKYLSENIAPEDTQFIQAQDRVSQRIKAIKQRKTFLNHKK